MKYRHAAATSQWTTTRILMPMPENLDAETRIAIPEQIRAAANKGLPAYSKLHKVELVDIPFEKTPKMSIRRYLYK